MKLSVLEYKCCFYENFLGLHIFKFLLIYLLVHVINIFINVLYFLIITITYLNFLLIYFIIIFNVL